MKNQEKEKLTNIRVLVNEDTYNILKNEQKKYYQEKQRKISLSDVILHYFSEGYNNANGTSESGLGIFIESIKPNNDQNSDQNSKHFVQNSNEREFFKLEMRQSELNQREYSLDNFEKQLKSKEQENAIKERDLQHKEWEIEEKQRKIDTTSNQEVIKNQMEMIKLKTELEYLRNQAVTNKDIMKEFQQVSKTLNTIETQTKKSTLDIILQFANPLISLIGFFQLNKKIKESSPELDQIQQQFQSIIANLKPNEQQELMSYVNQLQKEKSA
jgi:hypothetical protein